MEKIAEQLVVEVIRNGGHPVRFSFTDVKTGRTYRVVVEDERQIREDSIEKRGGRISAGPSGSPCPRCGGAGYV